MQVGSYYQASCQTSFAASETEINWTPNLGPEFATFTPSAGLNLAGSTEGFGQLIEAAPTSTALQASRATPTLFAPVIYISDDRPPGFSPDRRRAVQARFSFRVMDSRSRRAPVSRC